MLSILDPRTWLAAAAAIAGAYGGGRLQQYRHDDAAYRAKATAAALAASQVQLKAVDAARAEEQRRTAEQSRIAQDAAKQAESAQADARAAGAMADRLRVRVAELLAVGRAGANPIAASASAPADTTDALLAELFRRADERAGSLASDLDASRAAGLACEASYEALTPAH